MAENIYERLQEQIDQYSIGFPKTPSGVEMAILKKLFTPEEADMYLQLSMMLEAPDSVAERLGRNPEDVAEVLDRMAEKGLVFRLKRGGSARYGASPFVVGSYEYQLKTMDRELAELVESYMDQAFDKAFSSAGSILRPIPVNRSVSVNFPVSTYNDSRQIVRSQKKIAVADCICRVQQGMLDKGCDKPKEVCLIFGAHAEYYLSRDMAREITADEAVRVLDLAEEAGLVTQPFNAQNPGGMCNCCGDCCGVLRALNRLPNPADVVISNYYAAVNQDACVGCEVCLDRCQMGAISMNDDGVAEVASQRCIGCGLCVTTCAAEAMELALKPEQQQRMPPASNMEQAMQLAAARGTSLTPLFMKQKA